MTLAATPATAAKPEIMPVSDLVEGVLSGEITVPRFQRPYVWGPDDMLQLFDSVLHGYPIGSLLIWETDREDITSLDRLGPLELPENKPRLRKYVVDGHQRVATFVGVLTLPEAFPRDRQDHWRWWIAYDLRQNQVVHIKDNRSSIPYHLLPLRSILKTSDFARRTREMMSSGQIPDREIDDLVDRADFVQKAIREYRVPMTVMRSGSLDDAVTIFARVNQRGRDMTPDQMVSALTFRDKQEGDFDLAEEIDKLLGELREFGFADLDRRIILQIILALAGLDFTRPSYDKIVDRSSHDQLRPAVAASNRAIRSSIEFLTGRIGLRTSRLLPYASIVVMLAIFFNRAETLSRGTTEVQMALLAKWFWATSFNGWFAGANTTDLRRAGDAMASLAEDEGYLEEFEAFFITNRPIRRFPETFDRRSARVRASLLVQILAGAPKEPRSGQQFDAFEVFADGSTRDLPYFFPNQRRPKVSNPANRVILPSGYARNAKQFFATLRNDKNSDREILNSHFITNQAFEALLRDDFDNFISLREKHILQAEQEFLTPFGLIVDATATRNSEENDADEIGV